MIQNVFTIQKPKSSRYMLFLKMSSCSYVQIVIYGLNWQVNLIYCRNTFIVRLNVSTS